MRKFYNALLDLKFTFSKQKMNHVAWIWMLYYYQSFRFQSVIKLRGKCFWVNVEKNNFKTFCIFYFSFPLLKYFIIKPM